MQEGVSLLVILLFPSWDGIVGSVFLVFFISGNGFNPSPGRIEESRVEEASPQALVCAAMGVQPGLLSKGLLGFFFPPSPMKNYVISVNSDLFGTVWFWLSAARAGLGGSASQYGIIYR